MDTYLVLALIWAVGCSLQVLNAIVAARNKERGWVGLWSAWAAVSAVMCVHNLMKP